MVKTSPSDAGGVGLIPGKGELRSHMLHSQKTKTHKKNRSSTVTNSIKA